MKKGVTTIIVVLLLVITTIVFALMAFVFFSRTFHESSEAASGGLRSTTQSTKAMFEIFKTDFNNNKIYILNTGSVPINKVNVYINDQKVEANFSTINPGEIGTIDIFSPFVGGKNVIKITTEQGVFFQQEIVDVPNIWFFEIPDTSGICSADFCLLVE
jgi:hypothetical protein